MTAFWTKPEEAEAYDEWVNDLLANAPESFDGDEAAEAIVTKYIRWLEAERVRGRHARGCDGTSEQIKYEGPIMLSICSNLKCARVWAKCEHELPISGRTPGDPYTKPTTHWVDEQGDPIIGEFGGSTGKVGVTLLCTYCGKDVT